MELLQTMRQRNDHLCQVRQPFAGVELGCMLHDHGGGMHLDGRGLWWLASPVVAGAGDTAAALTVSG